MYNNIMTDDKKPINRRGLFREGFNFLGKVAGEFAAAVNVEQEEAGKGQWNPLEPKRGLLRPPGAIEEVYFLSLCDKCDECIKACPENVLFRAPENLGRAAGTPMFRPASKPCFLCDEFYCIKACDRSALKMAPRVKDFSMGVARLDSSKCLAHEGKSCNYCIVFCPLSGEAIIEAGGWPLIIADECVGCGQCEYHCIEDTGRRAITTLAPALQKES